MGPLGLILILVGIFFLVVLIMIIISKSKGKLEIHLEKYHFKPGEVITGTITMKMKKAVHAKALEAGLVGEIKSTVYVKTNTGGKRKANRNVRAFEFFYPVAGERVYHPGLEDYNFNIQIPEDILTSLSTGNKSIDSLVKSAQFLTGNVKRVKWYIVARLKIKGFDLRKKIQVNLG